MPVKRKVITPVPRSSLAQLSAQPCGVLYNWLAVSVPNWAPAIDLRLSKNGKTSSYFDATQKSSRI
jgi:hypothetical protein